MAWIRTLADHEAEGLIGRIYRAGVARAGRVWNIIRVTSLRAAPTHSSLRLYQDVMFAPSGLSRAERELVATIVSAANSCHY